MCSIEANICKAIQLAIDNSEMASKTFLLHIVHCFFEINDHSKTTIKVFSIMQLTYVTFFLAPIDEMILKSLGLVKNNGKCS